MGRRRHALVEGLPTCAAGPRPLDSGLVVTETDLGLGDGRTLHVYDTGAGDADERLAVFWHHGTPNVGAPPESPSSQPRPASASAGCRTTGPDTGDLPPYPDRDVASAADYVPGIAEALGIDRFAVMGHSGGGPHVLAALACGALLPERVLGVVGVSGLAPFGAEGLDCFAGMAASGVASLRAAAEGRAAKERYGASNTEFDPQMFTPADHAALSGP